ncbi:hypothetical protein [Streptomyces albireticuli]|uniref:hypothetical protein n=1 Tax=Streptomyces albireticuli TaxID=1940 RepID=UPI001E542154|nr:hypothetical protein [Streptomyces albireticuli]MCD9196075.1 hypothetical protein [Streptomyces albireticuli]
MIFADAQAAAAGVLRTALAGRSEPYAAGVTVGTRVPGDRSPEIPHLPYVLVRKDTDLPHSSMANTRATLRVTVWHTDADQAHDLAQLCQGLLIVHSGPVIRGVRPATGPLAAVDDTSRGTPGSDIDLSTFTVLANVRPATA